MEPKIITVNLLIFQDGSHYKDKYDLNGTKCIKLWLENESNPMINFLISQNTLADLKGPKGKYNLHYG